jgi:DNA repair ATPase RecN
MYYVVMLSRWQEAAVNKKYDLKVSEIKELRGEILNLHSLLDTKERDHHNAEVEVRKVKRSLLGTKQELTSARNLFLSID